MKKIFLLLSMFAIANVFAINPFVGEYVGTVEADRGFFHGNPDLSFQIYKQGDTYDIVAHFFLNRRGPELARFKVKESNGKLLFAGNGGYGVHYDGEVSDGKITGILTQKVNDNEIIKNQFSIEKSDRKSPTLGLKPSKGAVVLLDNNGDSRNNWNNFNWIHNEDGSWTVSRAENSGHTDIVSKEAFKGDFKMHIEFKCPDQTDRPLSQSRGNSGVFIGLWEIQILDSFGAEGLCNECAGLYRFMPPQVNACLPPETWQTYDIEYEAAEFKDEKMVEFPKITLYHNGIKVMNKIEITENPSNGTRYRKLVVNENEPLHIKLQDHGDPVSYRNLWLKLDKDD